MRGKSRFRFKNQNELEQVSKGMIYEPATCGVTHTDMLLWGLMESEWYSPMATRRSGLKCDAMLGVALRMRLWMSLYVTRQCFTSGDIVENCLKIVESTRIVDRYVKILFDYWSRSRSILDQSFLFPYLRPERPSQFLFLHSPFRNTRHV